ncbi:hypothetical protein BABINDRAFT_92199 [Babjeviella inositovora NRRL Y-12698]|uniref:Asp/Glu/hydantoin racemase n=1 Tax=Babjeviella inositovora NRRL Y-12698 TaxID=984486 RepID=A0A1E3QK36_9ASCO|nr:uncharacterized protein BABINDRAFT_92199 [Babjeviella inositovora NRRL Y-12698]ODQ78051.1 hypothetical protein BABINDRAFT_92199 [Babjeviella inositovora NRRL Y-12698]
MRSVCVINPNSSVSMTENLQVLLLPMAKECHLELAFFTAPEPAPKEIDGLETSRLSTEVCLPVLLPLLDAYDGFLVGCYSDHPLIYELQRRTDKPVLGIFQASLIAGVGMLEKAQKMVILTSNNEWERILDDSLDSVFQVDPQLVGHRNVILPTKALGINVLSLSDPHVYGQIKAKVRDLLTATEATCILLGCAGMSGLDLKLKQEPEFAGVHFVDSVRAGIQLLAR